MKIKSQLKAGRISMNHSPSVIRVKTRIAAGRLAANHNCGKT